MKKMNLALVMYTKTESRRKIYEAALAELAKTNEIAREALERADEVMKTKVGTNDDTRVVCEQINDKAETFIRKF